jgi:hypothetical protein
LFFWLLFDSILVADDKASVQFAFVFGLVAWPLTAAMFAIGLKIGPRRHWGERPEAERYPTPTWRRPLSRTSDRWLTWFLLGGIAGTASWLGGLITGSDHPWEAIPVSLAGVWFVVTAWKERRRRRTSE